MLSRSSRNVKKSRGFQDRILTSRHLKNDSVQKKNKPKPDNTRRIPVLPASISSDLQLIVSPDAGRGIAELDIDRTRKGIRHFLLGGSVLTDKLTALSREAMSNAYVRFGLRLVVSRYRAWPLRESIMTHQKKRRWVFGVSRQEIR